MKRLARRIVLIGALALAAACSPGQTAFEQQAEKTINTDDGEKLPVDVSDADCVAPQDTKADTTFSCEAVDDSGTLWMFVARITPGNTFEVSPA